MTWRKIVLGIGWGMLAVLSWFLLVVASVWIPATPSHDRERIVLGPEMSSEAVGYLRGAREAMRWYEHATLPAFVGIMLGLILKKRSCPFSEIALAAFILLLALVGVYGFGHPAKYLGVVLFFYAFRGANSVNSQHEGSLRSTA